MQPCNDNCINAHIRGNVDNLSRPLHEARVCVCSFNHVPKISLNDENVQKQRRNDIGVLIER